MHILVTGGAGLIGSHCVDRFIADGHQVTVIDNLSIGQKKYVHPKAKLYVADIRDRSAIATIFADTHPDVVIHCAASINARLSLEDPVTDAEANVVGTLNCFHEAQKNGITKFIFLSTGGVMYSDEAERPTPESSQPQPLAPYAIGKLSIEKYLDFFQKVHGIRTVSLRLANVYGPRQNPKSDAGVVSIFLKQMLQGKQSIIFGDGEQTRDFIFVDDVVNAITSAVNHFDITGVYNIGTGIETSVNAIVGMLLEYFPGVIPPSHGEPKSGEQRFSSLDASLAKQTFEWSPRTSIQSGIQKTVEWAKGTRDLA